MNQTFGHRARTVVTTTLFLLISLLSPLAGKAERYNFASIEGLAEQEVGRIVLTEVYRKMGIDITITPLPGKRAQAEVACGQRDGEIMRIFSYGENNSAVVRVSTPYYYLETMGFVKKGSSIKIGSQEDLGKLRVAKVSGVKHTDNITAAMPADKLIISYSTDNCMKAVLMGRVDVCLTNTADGKLIIKENGFSDLEQLEKPLAVLGLYHYLHLSKKDLVPKVDEMLKRMKQSGELAAITKAAEASVFSQFSN